MLGASPRPLAADTPPADTDAPARGDTDALAQADAQAASAPWREGVAPADQEAATALFVEALTLQRQWLLPDATALRAGARTRHAVVRDIGQKGLMRIDLETGDCEPVRLGVELQSSAVALEPSGDVLVAVELRDRGAVLRIDLTPMDEGGMPGCEVVSGAAVPGCGAARGMGPLLGLPTSLALDQAGERILVGDFAYSAVMAIDLATGDRTIVSDPSHGRGEPLVRPHTIVLTSDGERAMVLDEVLQAVVSIDLLTGDRRIVAGQSSGAPAVAFDLPRGLALYEDAERALLVDEEQQALFYVDLVTGERVILSQ